MPGPLSITLFPFNPVTKNKFQFRNSAKFNYINEFPTGSNTIHFTNNIKHNEKIKINLPAEPRTENAAQTASHVITRKILICIPIFQDPEDQQPSRSFNSPPAMNTRKTMIKSKQQKLEYHFEAEHWCGLKTQPHSTL